MQSVVSMNIKISVLPNFNAILVGCFILSGHIVHNIPNAYSVEGEASSGIDMTCVSQYGSTFPFCAPEATDELPDIDKVGPAAVVACLGLSLLVLYLKKQLEGTTEKGKRSVLPNSHSLALICAIACTQVAQHLRSAYGVQGAGINSKMPEAAACVSKFGSVFPFCALDVNHVNLSDDMIEMLSVALVGSLVLGLVVFAAKSLMQSVKSIDKKDQKSMLPNFHSTLLSCGVFFAHAAYNLRKTCGNQGTAAEGSVDSACVAKWGSVFPFCLPDVNNVRDSASTSKVLPAAIVGLIALSVVVMAANHLMQSYSSIDKKGKKSVLPNFHSLLLISSIFGAHAAHNLRNQIGILATASISETGVDASCVSHSGSVFPFCLPDTNQTDVSHGMIKMLTMAVIGSVVSALVVHLLVQQSNSIDKKPKKSVLPNAYSVVIMCGIFCAHLVHHLTGFYGELPSSAVLFGGIVKQLPNMALLVFCFGAMTLQMQSSTISKTRRVSVLPNLYSVMLMCCALCVHFIHNRPENTDTTSPEVEIGSILGASSAMQPFGHQDHAVPSNFVDIIPQEQAFIPASVSDSILAKGLRAGTASPDVQQAQESEVISKASPKAILASVLFAFIGLTLKMGANGSDQKGKKSVLPNFRSVLLICCILFGHVVLNWPSTFSEHQSHVSVYTGVDGVASWDEYGSVLPDTAEDLDNLLEVSPDLLDQPSDMLTAR